MTNTNGATPEQLNALSKPMPKRLIKRATVKGSTIDYVTARTVMNWLDHSVGRENWQTSYALIKASDPMTVECTLSIRVNGGWVGKADVGTESTWSPEKGAYSNALKRAGAAWGIARELYGEGNVHETDDAPPDAPEAPADSPPPTSKAGADKAPPDAHRQTLGERDYGNQGDEDTRPFVAKMMPDFKLWMVDQLLADHPNHAQNIIVEAMREQYDADGLNAIFDNFTVAEVTNAVRDNRAADADAAHDAGGDDGR